MGQRSLLSGQKPAAPQPVDANELKRESDAWAQDLANGHIEPKTYHDLYAKKDTLGKIGTLFGLLVSGAGAGLSHQPNAVMELMNKEIKGHKLHEYINPNTVGTFRIGDTNFACAQLNTPLPVVHRKK